jgi:hypothetical protein
VVCASGNLAHVYLTYARERLTTERILDKHPGLVETLIAHAGIGFVITVRGNGEVLVMGKDGARRLPSGGVDGEDPLLPFLGGDAGERALSALSELAAFPHSGDLIVNGAMLEKNAVVTFEEQVGTHGGLGGTQTEPFIIYPRRLKAARENLRGPAEIHAFLKTILS